MKRNELDELGTGGNTEPQSKRPKTGSRRRFTKVCFTLNNPEPDEKETLVNELVKMDLGFIIGDEIGESGTPHLQGYIEFKKQIYLTGLKKLNDHAHWEAARGDRQQNINYCSKDGNFINTFKVPRHERILMRYNNVVWKPWQQEIIDIIDQEPDDRTIHWYYDRDGNSGKSFLAKYLGLKYDAIIVDGKKNDIFHGVAQWCDSKDEESPRLVLADISRPEMAYISYAALEKLKSGIIQSGKYEGGTYYLEPLHVVIFANQEPQYDKMSPDRWNVVDIYALRGASPPPPAEPSTAPPEGGKNGFPF